MESGKQRKSGENSVCGEGKKGREGEREREAQIFPGRWEMVTDDLSSGWRQAKPVAEIITHSDEKVNEIDLNILSGDAVPAVARRPILHRQGVF